MNTIISKDTHIGHVVDDSLDEGLAHNSLLFGVGGTQKKKSK